MEIIKLNCTPSIMGSRIISKSQIGDSTKIEIISNGSFNAHHIPPVIVFCEDKVAEELITHALSYFGRNRGSFTFKRCGSWENIIISLAGCLLYSAELINSGNMKVLEVIGVIDGDISESDISEVISKTYKGDFVPNDLKEITDNIKKHITYFKLPEKLLSRKKTKGKPELNLKNMLDEIDEKKINNVFAKEKNKLRGWLESLSDDKSKLNIQFKLDDIEKEIAETLTIVSISKSITFPESDEGLNYHSYFKKLEKKLTNLFFTNYMYTHSPIFLIYRITSKFNKKRWEEYVNPVVKFLISTDETQKERFSHNTYNNHKID